MLLFKLKVGYEISHHWKLNSFMNSKLNSNHPETMVYLLHIISLRNIQTVKNFIQHRFHFLPLYFYFALCRNRRKNTAPNNFFAFWQHFSFPCTQFMTEKNNQTKNQTRSSVYSICVKQNEKKKCMTLLCHEELSHHNLSVWYVTLFTRLL